MAIKGNYYVWLFTITFSKDLIYFILFYYSIKGCHPYLIHLRKFLSKYLAGNFTVRGHNLSIK